MPSKSVFSCRNFLLALVFVSLIQIPNAFQLSPASMTGARLQQRTSFSPSLPSFSQAPRILLRNDIKMMAADATATVPQPTASSTSPTPSTEKLKPSAAKTMKKLFPLGAMLFFILFNYTILRDTKDVLVVTAPNSGAEIIPFLKTYVNLPSAIGFTILYSSLTNKMPSDKVFYLVMTSFISFFAAFAGIICK